jgi:hypothetical protein
MSDSLNGSIRMFERNLVADSDAAGVLFHRSVFIV